MFVVIGFLSILVTVLAYLNPHVRNVEDELPDAIQPSKMEAVPEGSPGETLPIAPVTWPETD
jgi:hypothetical protein